MVLSGSSPAVGSSYNRISGFTAMARAKPTLFFIPPESSEGYLAASCSRPTSSKSSRHPLLDFSSGKCRCCLKPKATFSPTDKKSNRAEYWKTMPIFLRSSFHWSSVKPVTSWPSTSTCPPEGFNKPIKHPQDSTFSAAGRADDCQGLPRHHIQV
jgi:hypothetical protein